MIYLILTGALDESENLVKLLKIGYTDNIDKRFILYKSYCIRCKLLYTIPDCTEEDEKRLHRYFKKYKNYGEEWYNYEDDIIEFFKSNDTREKLLESIKNIVPVKPSKSKILKDTSEYYLRYAPRIIESLNYNNLDPEKYKKLCEIKRKIRYLVINNCDILEGLKSEYPGIDFDKEDILGEEEKKILDEINKINFFHNKMKYIYNLGMQDDVARVVLDNLDDTDFSKYYWSIDKGKASALKYQKGNLEEEYNRLDRSNKVISSVNDLIKDDIYSTFQVGETYLRIEIRQMLQEIYDKTGFSRPVSALDLEKYFELGIRKITNKKTGKRDPAFKIIKKKE